MKWYTAVIGALFVSVTSGIGRSQLQHRGTTVAGEMIQLDQGRGDTAKKFSVCCKTIPLGSNALIVQNLQESSHELGGILYFDQGKVGGIASDRSWTAEASPYETALAFFRAIDQITHGTPTTATVFTSNRELSNANSKFVVLQFSDGRRIRIEVTHMDPGADIAQQVLVSECVGNCTDW